MYQTDQQKTKAETHVEELQKQAHREHKKTKRLDTKIEKARKENEQSHGH